MATNETEIRGLALIHPRMVNRLICPLSSRIKWPRQCMKSLPEMNCPKRQPSMDADDDGEGVLSNGNGIFETVSHRHRAHITLDSGPRSCTKHFVRWPSFRSSQSLLKNSCEKCPLGIPYHRLMTVPEQAGRQAGSLILPDRHDYDYQATGPTYSA